MYMFIFVALAAFFFSGYLLGKHKTLYEVKKILDAQKAFIDGLTGRDDDRQQF